MISKEILEEANKLIGGDRNDDYGDKLTNHQNIAALWSIFLRKNITPHDAAIERRSHYILLNQNLLESLERFFK